MRDEISIISRWQSVQLLARESWQVGNRFAWEPWPIVVLVSQQRARPTFVITSSESVFSSPEREEKLIPCNRCCCCCCSLGEGRETRDRSIYAERERERGESNLCGRRRSKIMIDIYIYKFASRPNIYPRSIDYIYFPEFILD